MNAVPLGLAIGDFAVLTGDLLLQFENAGLNSHRGGFGPGDVDLRGGNGRSSGLLGEFALDCPLFGLRADDHHQDDQNADEVGHHVQERILSGCFGLIGFGACGVHAISE